MDDLFDVTGKSALVTGGTRGIGLMIARGLVARGVRTFIVGRDAQTCATVSAELSQLGLCFPISADLSTLSGIDALTSALISQERALNILVNNAGAMYEAPLGSFSEEGWDSVVNLNVKTEFFLTQQLLPFLRRAASARAHASVINIGSAGAVRIGAKENYSYQAAKAALHYLTASLAKRLGPENITVNAIAPALFPSRLTGVISESALSTLLATVPRRRLGDADDVVGAVLYLSSRAGSFVTGTVIPVAGGMAL